MFCVIWPERFTLIFVKFVLSLLPLQWLLLWLLFVECVRVWFGLWEREGEVVVGVEGIENGRGERCWKNEEMSMLSVGSDGVFRNVKIWGDSWTLSRRESVWVCLCECSHKVIENRNKNDNEKDSKLKYSFDFV